MVSLTTFSLPALSQVFVRELVSNASDAIERLRFQNASQTAAADQPQNPMEIRIRTDKSKKLLVIEDTGIGMTREEMEDNLGTIARSGSREFVAGLKNEDQIVNNTDIIGQFGVGFYATFMVANKVEVFSRSQSGDKTSTVGYRWSSTGHDGEFEMCEMQDVPPGTKIVLHLKDDALEFADDEVIDKILRKYSNFVTAPIFLNDRRVNVIEPTWLKDPAKITDEEHLSFYQYLCGNTYDSPRYSFMYKTDAPINLRVLLYVPNFKPSLFDMARDTDSGVSLYSRKVLILNRTAALLPKWLRFMRGIVDSEDVPLNLSRELLQDSALINRIKRLLTGRIIRFFSRNLTSYTGKRVRKNSKNTEVLFLYEPYDELVLMQLGQFDKKRLTSIETMVAEDAADTDSVGPERPNCLTQEQANRLVNWAQMHLGNKVKKVKVTQRLTNHPCFVSVREAGAMRHFLRTTLADRPAEERFHVMEPILELNPEHELVRYLSDLVESGCPVEPMQKTH
ncbi:Heat shock protein 75 mitochondrial [Fasciola gigantica]|uniref:Heat shock protein 75 mitochondrial n=1 Tax=Fasciola gigantica TaxID=46835 RepID=A0A504YYW3_FASGI|nr:Heat shock protein 75 mitochondrial [Fasciola gigantica]